MTAAATATPEASLHNPTAGLLDPVETGIPDFTKLKKAELVEFYTEHYADIEAADLAPEQFKKLKAPEMRTQLKAFFPDPEALDSPEVTGFDPNDVIHQTVAEVQAIETQDEAIEKILSAQDVSEFNFFVIGGVLASMQANSWGGEGESFYAFVLETFGYKIRKAQILIQVYHKLVGCGATWAEAKVVGWGKLAVIATHLEPENYKDWFKKAANATHLELAQLVKAANANGAPPDPNAESTPLKKLTFAIHEDQEETIQEAIQKAKELGDTTFDGQALELMSADFLAGDAAAASDGPVEESQADAEESAGPVDLRKLFESLTTASGNSDDAAQKILTAFDEVFGDIHVVVYMDGKPELSELVEGLTEEHSLDEIQEALDSVVVEAG